MKRKITRLIIIVMSLAMVFLGMALSVNAADKPVADVAVVAGKAYASIEEALEAAKPGETVKLISDVNVDYCVISKNTTLDMNGYSISSASDSAFVIDGDVKFSIVGFGNINLEGKLVEPGMSKPMVSVTGTKGSIFIEHDGMSSPYIVRAAFGTYTFNNVHVNSVTTGSSAATFCAYEDKGKVKWNFIGFSCDMKGCSIGGGPYAESIVRAQGESTVYINNSTLRSDGCCVSLSGNKSTETVLTVEDSSLTSISATYEISAVGMYATVYGDIVIRNSVVESSYRVFAINNENIPTEVETSEDGIISPVSGPSLKVYDSTIYLNSFKATQIVRAFPSFFYGDTRIIIGSNLSALIQYDTGNEGYIYDNKYVNMYLAEGTRISSEAFTTKSVRGFKFPDGSSPGTSETYKFIYDPIGDSTAPYVVTKIGATDTVDITNADYFYFANGNNSYTNNVSRIIYDGDKAISSSVSGDMLGVKSHWWNRVGQYSITVVGGNPCFKYVTTEANESSSRGPQVILGKGMSNSIYEPDYSLIIGEVDFATDTGAYPNVAMKFHARGSSSGDADATGHSNYSDGTNGIKLNSDGSIEGFGLTLNGSYSASTTGWNRLSFVIDATYTGAPYKTTHTYGGKMYVYLNGTLIGVGDRAFIEGAYIFGIRGDITNYQLAGRSLLLDNATMRAYKNVSPSFNYEKYVGSEYDLGHALNTELVDDSITVGKIPYPDLDSAFAAASAAGTLPNINRDVYDAGVSFNGVVSVNGNALETTPDSNKASVYLYPDGRIAAYEFDSKFNGYTTKYHWFRGDLSNPDEWLDHKYYSVTEVSIGQMPQQPNDVSILPSVDKSNYTVSYHSGWDYDGDGNDAEALGVLTYALALSTSDIYLYPTYEDKAMTVVVEDNDGSIVYYSTENNLDSSVWSNLKSGMTLKLLSDFEVSGASGFTPSANGGVYNIDFNGHTIFQSKKCNYISVQNGAILNIYSSVPGGMYYGIELSESTSDKNVHVGAGVFVQLKDTGTESLAAAAASTYATSINIGTVSANGKTYPGSNLTLAGDCIIEPRVGGYNAKINVDGATLLRTGSDYAAMILTRYYYGAVDVKNTVFILASNALNVYGNHINADGALGTASFDNCVFLYRVNGDEPTLIYRNLGQKSILFKNCVSNGRMNPSKTSGVTQVAEGNATPIMQFSTKDYLSGVKLAKYGAPMQVPNIITSNYYNPNHTDSDTPYISVIDGGIMRIQLWARSSSTSLGQYGGAVTDGYLYIVPYGYKGSVPSDAKTVLEMPILEQITTKETVEVTYKDLSGNVIKTETYAKGGAIYEYPELTVPSVEDGLITKVHNGKWDKELPVTDINADTVLNPLFDSMIELEGLKTSISLYTDFSINLYIPAEYKSKITSVTYGEVELELTDVSVEGKDYVKAVIALGAHQAAESAVFEINLVESGIEVKCCVGMSIAEYAESVLSDSASTDADIKLVKYMVSYAAAALDYFRGKTDSKLDSMLEEVADYTVGEALDTSALSAVFSGATLKLGPSLSYAFILKDGFAGTVSIMGRDFEISADSDREIVIDALTLIDFAADAEITVTDTQGNVLAESRYNLSTYLQYHIANANNSKVSERCLGIARAFYNYVNAASEYVK